MSANPSEPPQVESCRACHSPQKWREILRMDPMPLAGQFCRTLQEAQCAERFPLTWVECANCGLVQVCEDIDDRILFTEYNYASSTIHGLTRHFDSYANFLRTRYEGIHRPRLLEIGCNDGVLLRRLPKDWALVGIDPSDVAARAPDKTYELVSAPFNEATAKQIPHAGAYDVVTGSNCLAHISDLMAVFRGVHTVLRAGGEFIVEVHDLAETVESGQWDTIYHEHKAEWSAESMTACLAPLGFALAFVDKLPLHGGLLRLGFRKVNAAVPASPRVPRSYERVVSAYRTRRDTPTYQEIQRVLASGGTVSAYGASGRANVWLNQLPELKLSYIVDDSPLRSGKWIPSVSVPVVSPERFINQPTDLCVITAWNYAADIRAKYPRYAGRWLQSLCASEE